MNKDRKDHFWIPDEEVQRIDKKITSRPKDVPVHFAEHGIKLSDGLRIIEEALDNSMPDSSLSEMDMLVFNVRLQEGQKIQDKKNLFDANGMRVRAVRDIRSAVVTSTHGQFKALKKRVGSYCADGDLKTYFDHVESFGPHVGTEKDSGGLRKTMLLDERPDALDVQFMLIPDMESEEYGSALKKLIEKIERTDGQVQGTPYFLSDRTPVIRAIIPASALPRYENDPAIYRIEKTDFFSVGASQTPYTDLSQLSIAEDVDLNALPIVAVLDSGVAFPLALAALVLHQWTAPGSEGGDCDHGTKVAGRVALGYIGQQSHLDGLIPKARIIDCNILGNDPVPVNTFIQRIQAAAEAFADTTKVFNLSANANVPIEGDEMSIIGYELDVLQLQKGIQFIVSTGNHALWKTESSLDRILDDDDSRIASPADSMHSIVVGAVVGADHVKSMSKRNNIAPYSRRGPGFKGLSKPDLTAFSGTVVKDAAAFSVPIDDHSLLLSKGAAIMSDAGTSFSAPIVAGDYACVLNTIPGCDVLLARALMYHNAVPFWKNDGMTDEELASMHNLYGRGTSNVSNCIYSSASKVTFVRTGTLNRTTKERVSIHMPQILAARPGRNTAKVSVTCLSAPTVDRTKGTEYLGAYIRASLKKSGRNGRELLPTSQDFDEGRQKWDVCYQFSKSFSRFNAGDWQIWLELFSRWDDKSEDVPYALVVTVEDMSKTMDIYSRIEALNRYRPLNTIRIRAEDRNTG